MALVIDGDPAFREIAGKLPVQHRRDAWPDGLARGRLGRSAALAYVSPPHDRDGRRTAGRRQGDPARAAHRHRARAAVAAMSQP
jgi:hypothetical protein